ncbi:MULTISPECIES: cell division protein FtsL [unclassified Enterococcus]|uniref:cell division protein FtsL n=1 Tax=unclassified Enterococcus TaxID=2608891 RepID=UPI0019075717|nr:MULTISPECIES: cell division protein FtsL [unclassified Enterococcus]MBK0037735.1 cell division protein FtsL [Enterococcus sp. S52]MBK0070998.1 cell division protein FtsL [Enterococcus sp. S53]MBK0141523.1 cell division protein FtsL [Enterococcus sp. S76]MBK0145050.1 cell division protein FtsL [Enterococcus sp. S77]
MAELKVHDYEFREPFESQPLDHSEPTTEKLPTDPQRPEVIRVLASPARRLKSISTLEKLIAAFVIIAVLTLAILTINIRTNISQVEHDISLIQSDISEKTTQAEQLEQEKNELSKTERIQKIAEDNGLSIDDGNLRKVD